MAFPDHMDHTEKCIAGALIDRALNLGYSISVWDGEDFGIEKSRDQDAITAEVAATDETVLHFFSPTERWLGWVMLIHGNGEDVISDMVDNQEMTSLTANIEIQAAD